MPNPPIHKAGAMAPTESQQTPRVLSLLSASTEIVYRLGCGHLLVGRSHGCDDPPLAGALPIATAPKMDPNASSREIDEAVRVQVEEGGPVYHIYNSVVATCKPSVILTQEMCRICAVTQADVEAACTALPASTRIVTIKPETLDDVLGDVRTIAGALGVEARGARLISHLRGRIDLVAETTKALAAASGRPKVVHLEWLAPLMGSGYWIAELVAAAGGDMLHGSIGSHSQVIPSFSSLQDADVILLAACGFSIERTHAELNSEALRDSFLKSDAWCALPAVKAGRVYVADGNKYFNRSSCGVAEAAEILAELCWEHELCGLWGHHGQRWVRLGELEAFCTRVDAAPPKKRVVVHREESTACPPKVAKSSGAAATAAAKSSAAELHVCAQMDAMRASDYELAFSLNSSGNQKRLGTAETFASVVKGNISFAALAASTADLCTVSDASTCATIACEGATKDVRVMVPSSIPDEAPLNFGFQLSSEKGTNGEWGWKTDGVKICC